MLGIVGGDEPRAYGLVGHLVTGRENVVAAGAENNQSCFLVAALGRGDERVDRGIGCFVVLLRERGRRCRKEKHCRNQ